MWQGLVTDAYKFTTKDGATPVKRDKTPRKQDHDSVKVEGGSPSPSPAPAPSPVVTRSSTRAKALAMAKAGPLPPKPWSCTVCCTSIEHYDELLEMSDDSDTFQCPCCGSTLKVASLEDHTFVVVDVAKEDKDALVGRPPNKRPRRQVLSSILKALKQYDPIVTKPLKQESKIGWRASNFCS